MGIKLAEGDACLGGALISDGHDALVMETSGGKTLEFRRGKYELTSRAGKGFEAVKRSTFTRVVPGPIELVDWDQIEGKVKKVDHEKSTLTITTDDGKERTFEITDDTTMVGPRGGLVRRGLKDPRFHEGMGLTIVAKGTTATEVHLGFSPRNTWVS